MEKEKLIEKIVSIEHNFFRSTKSIDGPAPCQSQENTFILARTAQWSLYPNEVLESYLNDLENSLKNNQNLISIKYGYMMKNTSPSEYEKIKNKLPLISEKKENMIEAIVLINMFWEEEVRKDYINLANKNRPLYSKDDTLRNVSIETYLRGEFSTYSENTLELLVNFYKDCFDKKMNLVYENFRLLYEKKNSYISKSEVCNQKKKNISTISLKDARALKNLALKKAEEMNIAISVTLLDSTGNILLLERMEEAIIASIEISKNKAFTAFSLNETTYELQKNNDIKNINLHNINGIPLCFLGGGAPIRNNNKLIGAIGISGGKVTEDIEILNFVLENWN